MATLHYKRQRFCLRTCIVSACSGILHQDKIFGLRIQLWLAIMHLNWWLSCSY